MSKEQTATMAAGEAVMVEVSKLNPHQLNREWKKDEEFSSLRESVRRYGVLTPLLVSQREDGTMWIIAGERRWRSAKALKLATVPAVVRAMTAKEELEVLVIENLERQDPDPVEESRLVRALLDEGYEPSVLADRLSRSVEWIETRQMILDLGEEVHECLRRPREDDRHLSIGAAIAIAAVPAKHRESAMQLVLHPDYQDGPLSAARAQAAVKAIILDPLRRARDWADAGPRLKKAWQKRLREKIGKAMAADLAVMLGGVDEKFDGSKMMLAENELQATDAVMVDGMGKTWAHLAAKHGLSVRVIPDEDSDMGSACVVDGPLLRMAENAHRENNLECWLAPDRSAPAAPAGENVMIPDDEDEDDAEDHDREEPETVIEQTMESYAQIRMTEVRSLGRHALALETEPTQAIPEGLPGWAERLLAEGRYADVQDVCEWVMGLRD